LKRKKIEDEIDSKHKAINNAAIDIGITSEVEKNKSKKAKKKEAEPLT